MSLTFFYSVSTYKEQYVLTNLRLPAGCHVGISRLWRPGVEGMWPNPYPTSSFLHTHGRAVAISTFTHISPIFRRLIFKRNDLDLSSLRPALVTWLTCHRRFGKPCMVARLTWRRNSDLELSSFGQTKHVTHLPQKFLPGVAWFWPAQVMNSSDLKLTDTSQVTYLPAEIMTCGLCHMMFTIARHINRLIKEILLEVGQNIWPAQVTWLSCRRYSDKRPGPELWPSLVFSLRSSQEEESW
jgi:hypothetical protein